MAKAPYIITSKTRTSRLPHGKTFIMRRTAKDEDGSEGMYLVDERKADKRMKQHQHNGVYHDPEPIPGYTDKQEP